MILRQREAIPDHEDSAERCVIPKPTDGVRREGLCDDPNALLPRAEVESTHNLLVANHSGRLSMLPIFESQRFHGDGSHSSPKRYAWQVLDILTFFVPFQSSHRLTSGSNPSSKNPSAYSANYRAHSHSDSESQNEIGVIHS